MLNCRGMVRWGGKLFLFMLFSILIMPLQTFAINPPGTVNVLAWWSYADLPEISAIIKKTCDVDVYYDEFYSNSEFFKRISADKNFYDVIIFPDTIYEVIKDKIEVEKSKLNAVTENYVGCIRDHYLSQNYPNNIAFFMLSFSGFVWNPKIINLSKDDLNISIFKKVKNNIAILTNDPIEVCGLVEGKRSQALSSPKTKSIKRCSLATKSFEDLIQNASVYITNGHNKLYNHDKFAVAFQRVGDAVFNIKNANQELEFLTHPVLSRITIDLIAEVNERPETQCVAKVLASKEVLDIVQGKTYYLSPYGTYKLVNDPIYKKVYESLHDDVCGLPWLNPASVDEYDDLLKAWNEIHLLPQIWERNGAFAKSRFT